MIEVKGLKINYKLLFPVLSIYLVSLLTIYSTIPGLYINHLTYFVLGIVIFFITQFIDIEFYIKYSYYIYFFVLALLILIFIIGHTALGASRWLKVGSLSIQPSELAKISLLLVITNIWSNVKEWKLKFIRINNKFVQGFVIFVPMVFLVLIQPDLGTSIMISLIFFTLLFISNFDKKYIFWFFMVCAVFSSSLWNLLQPYQKERVIVFLNPERDKLGAGYNSIQATIAFGSGGFLGKGFQKGTQTQLNFLPIFWTDFLVATYAEEYGFLGIVCFLLLYFLFIKEILNVFLKSQKVYEKFILVGIFTYFAFQFLINTGMNIGLLPVTGIPVPFFSYGGTSLVSSMFLFGLLNKISAQLN